MDKSEEAKAKDIVNFIIPSNIEMVRMGLGSLFAIHEATNQLVKHEGGTLSERLATTDVLRTYTLALVVELGEWLQEMNWKPWRAGRPHNKEKVLDEFADILAFVGVLLTIMKERGYTIKEIVDAYEAKEYVNTQRFIEAAGGKR